MTLQNPELLPLAGADCPARRRLTKTKEEETIIINRSGRPLIPKRNPSQEAEPPLLAGGSAEALFIASADRHKIVPTVRAHLVFIVESSFSM